jgi:hypothetical protein
MPNENDSPARGVCPACFALVDPEQAALHMDWHDRLVSYLVGEMLKLQRLQGRQP